MNNNNQNSGNNGNNGQQMQIEIKPEVATGMYSNFTVVSHSATEFTLDFAAILPGLPKALVNSRIIMTPENALRLCQVLQQNLQSYEKQFGMRQKPLGGQTIAPFGKGGNGELN